METTEQTIKMMALMDEQNESTRANRSKDLLS
jgi:hypothetical protein